MRDQKHNYLILLAILLANGLLVLVSCGVDPTTEGEDQIARAEHLINQKRYVEAIQVLEGIPTHILAEEQKTSLLAYAHLGTLDLDLPTVYRFVDSLKSFADENEKTTFSREALDRLMAKLPKYNQQSTATLDKVIDLLKDSPEFEAHNPKLKHLYIGSLYAYHFIIRLKRLFTILVEMEKTGKEPQESVSTILIELIKDLEQIEKNYSQSFEKVQNVAESFNEKFHLVSSNEL